MGEYPIFLFCLIFIAGLNVSRACNGYKLRIIKIEGCGGSSRVFKIHPNATARFSNDCKVIVDGCAETVGFQTANVKYVVNKSGNRIVSGSEDVCADLEKDVIGFSTFLKSADLPYVCPIKPISKCVTGLAYDISEYKMYLPIVRGKLELHLEGEYDTGKSCTNIVVEVSMAGLYG